MRELSKSEQRKTNGGGWCIRFNRYLGATIGHSPVGTAKFHTDKYLGYGSNYGGSAALPYAYGS